jgi:hypothetical protein
VPGRQRAGWTADEPQSHAVLDAYAGAGGSFVDTANSRGLEALRAWARTPVRVTPLRSEALLRVLVTDLVGEATTRESIGTLREDVADLFARLAETELRADSLPHRSKYLLLVVAFLRRLLELHLELVDEVERELDGDRGRG